MPVPPRVCGIRCAAPTRWCAQRYYSRTASHLHPRPRYFFTAPRHACEAISPTTDPHLCSSSPPVGHTAATAAAATLGPPSLAVRLLQPCAAWEGQEPFPVPPAGLLDRRTERRCGVAGPRPWSTPCARSRPHGPERAAVDAPTAAAAASPSPSSSFPIEFVSAYGAAVRQGMGLGLGVAERDALRRAALTTWLRASRATPEGCTTPLAPPTLPAVFLCVAEEVAAIAHCFGGAGAGSGSTTTSSSSNSSHAGARTHEGAARDAAWHAFCLRSLLSASGPHARGLDRLLTPLHEIPQLPPAVQEVARAAARTTPPTGTSVGLSDGSLLQWLEAQGDGSPLRDGYGSTHCLSEEPDWLCAPAATRPRPRARTPTAPDPLRDVTDGAATTVAAGAARTSGWAALSAMWAGRCRALVRAQLEGHAVTASAGGRSTAPCVSLSRLRADAALQGYARRLRTELCAASVAAGSGPEMLAVLRRSAASSPALAEVGVFLFAMYPPAPGQVDSALAGPRCAGGSAWLPFTMALTRGAACHDDGAELWPALLVESLCDLLRRTTPAASAERIADVVALAASVVAAARSSALLHRCLDVLRSSPALACSRSSPASAADSAACDWSVDFLLEVGTHLQTTTDVTNAASPDVDFAVGFAVELGTALLAHWRLTGAGRDRAYRLPGSVEACLWRVYIPLVTRLLQSPLLAGGETSRAVDDALLPSACAVCRTVALLWDTAVCPARGRHRRRQVRAGAAAGASAIASPAPLCVDMLAEIALAESAAGRHRRSIHDYAAPSPVPAHTTDLAALLTLVLERAAPAGDGCSPAAPTPPPLLPESAVLSQVCSAALIVLREIDTVWAARLLRALDAHARPLHAAGRLDARAALRLLRCAGAARFGCPVPLLAARYFAVALTAPGPLAEGGEALWQGELLRTVQCIATSVPADPAGGGALSHAERGAALVRLVAFARANGVRVSAEVHAALQFAFAARRCPSGRSGCDGDSLLSGAPWTDVAAQYRDWLAGEAHVRLLLHLPVLQLGCARSLLALGRWERACGYVPAAEKTAVTRHILAPASGATVPSELARLHVLLYLCATDPTQSCGTAAKAIAARLLAESPDRLKAALRLTWRRWYRASLPLSAAPPPPAVTSAAPAVVAAAAAAAEHPLFRPYGGQCFVPQLDAATEREGQIRMRFTGSGGHTFFAQCCASLAGSVRGSLASRPALALQGRCADDAGQHASAAEPHSGVAYSVELKTLYVGVASALRQSE